MKKLITTLALTLGLLFGGGLAPAIADDDTPPPPPTTCSNDEAPPCEPPAPVCDPDEYPPDEAPCRVPAPTCEPTANDHRVQVLALQSQVGQLVVNAQRLQKVADRRAAKIKELRAKIRALR